MYKSSNHIRDSLSLVGGKLYSSPGSQQHRRGHSLNHLSKDSDENLDLFSRNRRSLSVASSDESSDVSVKLGRLSVGSAKLARSPVDDLLSTGEGGKNDYDWLLTPPGTPQYESQPISTAPRSSSLSRSVSTMKSSRLSVSHQESNNSTRPTRSSSVTRPAPSSQFTTYSSNRSNTNILNTSSASVSSYTRPSSPVTRSSSTARPSTPSVRSTPSRSSTPLKTRVSPTSNTSVDKARPSVNSRPSTPSSRPQVSANSSSVSSRPSSRPSTPTRRNSAPLQSPMSGSSAGRVLPNVRAPAPSSRPSSPSPRVRPPPQPVVPPDFSLDAPPNLRTTLPDRPISAGRSRPGASITVKGSPEPTIPANVTRRHSSPVVTRGRQVEPPVRSRVQANGHVSDVSEPRKALHSSELNTRKPVKVSTTPTENTGLGRTISKKSLDMAIKHMDIRNGTGNGRSHSGATLFPQSIRPTPSKSQSSRSLTSLESNNASIQNGDISQLNSLLSRHLETGNETKNGRYFSKFSGVDMYESSRYDAILSKEDSKNTSWLHSVDDDQVSIFDNGFEPLPELFDTL